MFGLAEPKWRNLLPPARVGKANPANSSMKQVTHKLETHFKSGVSCTILWRQESLEGDASQTGKFGVPLGCVAQSCGGRSSLKKVLVEWVMRHNLRRSEFRSSTLHRAEGAGWVGDASQSETFRVPPECLALAKRKIARVMRHNPGSPEFLVKWGALEVQR